MESQYVLNHLEVDGGELLRCEVNPNLSTFHFKDDLVVVSYAGWQVTRAFGFGGKEALLGSRDVQDNENQTIAVLELLKGYRLAVFIINRCGLFQLQFLNDKGDRISINIISDLWNDQFD